MPTYIFDEFGNNPANLINNEKRTLAVGNASEHFVIVPDATPYYGDSLVLVGPDGDILEEGIDYVPTHKWQQASDAVGQDIFGTILILDPNFDPGSYSYQYQTLGGDYVDNRANAILDGLVAINSVQSYSNVDWSTAPATFPPTQHTHGILSGLVGMDEILTRLTEIKDAVISAYSDIHIADIVDFGDPTANPILFEFARIADALESISAGSGGTQDLSQIQQDIQALETTVNNHISTYQSNNTSLVQQVNALETIVNAINAQSIANHSVADIAARDLQQANIKVGENVLVDDATADPSVDIGWAIYKKMGASSWLKISEEESIDQIGGAGPLTTTEEMMGRDVNAGSKGISLSSFLDTFKDEHYGQYGGIVPAGQNINMFDDLPYLSLSDQTTAWIDYSIQFTLRGSSGIDGKLLLTTLAGSNRIQGSSVIFHDYVMTITKRTQTAGNPPVITEEKRLHRSTSGSFFDMELPDIDGVDGLPIAEPTITTDSDSNAIVTLRGKIGFSISSPNDLVFQPHLIVNQGEGGAMAGYCKTSLFKPASGGGPI